jgi:DtxR family Mn-dependent transcriptional regulator
MPKIILNTAEARYLAEIYRSLERSEKPTTGKLANTFKVRPASVVDVLNRLSRKQLVKRAGWGRFVLTPKGAEIAASIIRNHRVLETYFCRELEIPPDLACAEAAKIDYLVGKTVVDRLWARLDNPDKCIHGWPM